MTVQIDTTAEIAAVRLENVSTPSSPATGHALVFSKGDGLYYESASGTVIGPLSTGTVMSAGGGALVLLEQHTASSSASLAFTGISGTSYDEYVFELINVLPATNNVDFYIQVSTNGGSSYDSSSLYSQSIFLWIHNATVNTGFSMGSPAGNFVTRNAAEIGNTSSYGVNGTIHLFNPSSSAVYKILHGDLSYLSSAPNLVKVQYGAVYQNTAVVNALKFYFSSGNISSGTIRLYGISKS